MAIGMFDAILFCTQLEKGDSWIPDSFLHGWSSNSVVKKQHLKSSCSFWLWITIIFFNVVTAAAVPSPGDGTLQDIWSLIKLRRWKFYWMLLNIGCSSAGVHRSIWRAGVWNEKLNGDHAYKKAIQTLELESLHGMCQITALCCNVLLYSLFGLVCGAHYCNGMWYQGSVKPLLLNAYNSCGTDALWFLRTTSKAARNHFIFFLTDFIFLNFFS